MFLLVLSRARWDSPILVTMAIFGLTIAASSLISPRPRIPISMTAARCFFVNLSRVRGTPISLFRFPSFFRMSISREMIEASISLVVVLPDEPVTPIKGMLNLFRWAAARTCRAFKPSLTKRAAPPRFRTSGINLAPLKFSPLRGIKSSPGFICLESVERAVNPRSVFPSIRASGRSPMISATVNMKAYFLTSADS